MDLCNQYHGIGTGLRSGTVPTYCSDMIACKEAKVPAVGMTLTSFPNIHMIMLVYTRADKIQLYENLYTALEGSWVISLAQFSSTFAPHGPASVDLLKLIKDKGSDHALVKDSANAAVAQSPRSLTLSFKARRIPPTI